MKHDFTNQTNEQLRLLEESTAKGIENPVNHSAEVPMCDTLRQIREELSKRGVHIVKKQTQLSYLLN